MLPGRTFQEGATYLKAVWSFVLESVGLGTSRTDLDAELRRREEVCLWKRSERQREVFS